VGRDSDHTPPADTFLRAPAHRIISSLHSKAEIIAAICQNRSNTRRRENGYSDLGFILLAKILSVPRENDDQLAR